MALGELLENSKVLLTNMLRNCSIVSNLVLIGLTGGPIGDLAFLVITFNEAGQGLAETVGFLYMRENMVNPSNSPAAAERGKIFAFWKG